jgi:hypothetical protein
MTMGYEYGAVTRMDVVKERPRRRSGAVGSARLDRKDQCAKDGEGPSGS